MTGRGSRVLLDLQSVQSRDSSFRGLGRYSLNLARALIRSAPPGFRYEAAYTPLLPSVHVSEVLGYPPVADVGTWVNAPHWTEEAFRHNSMSYDRHTRGYSTRLFLSPFEGFPDPVIAQPQISRTKRGPLNAGVLYDLIPFLYPDVYLVRPGELESYAKRVDNLRHFDMIFAISASARADAIDLLHIPEERVRVIGAGVDPIFRRLRGAARVAARTRVRSHGIRGRYVLCISPTEFRKNLPNLLRAWAFLPAEMRRGRQLVIVGFHLPSQRRGLLSYARRLGLAEGDVVLLSGRDDNDMVAFYNFAELLVLPSLYEGFGLPIIEAIRCGTPALGSNVSSIPEILREDRFMFDPRDPYEIASRMERALEDARWSEVALATQESYIQEFTWDVVAAKVSAGLIELSGAHDGPPALRQGVGTRPLRLVAPEVAHRYNNPSYARRLRDALLSVIDVELAAPSGLHRRYGPGSLPATSTSDVELGRLMMLGNNWNAYGDVVRELLGVQAPWTILELHEVLIPDLGIGAFSDPAGRDPRDVYPKRCFTALKALFTQPPSDVDVPIELSRVLLREMCSNVEGVIVHSERDLALFRDLVPDFGGRVKMIPHAVDRRAHTDVVDVATKKMRLFGSPVRQVVTCFGTIEAGRRIEDLIDALGRIEGVLGPDLVLVGSGNAPYVRELELRASRHGVDVVAATSVRSKTVSDMLIASDVIVALGGSIDPDGTSSEILEAMSLAKPVVSYGQDRFNEQSTALLRSVPLGDHELLVRCLQSSLVGRSLMEDDSSSVQGGVDTSWESVRDLYLLLIDEVGKSSARG